ncbi:hypothetical protein GCM10027347_54880 [Larkinella harenae]
MKPNTLLAAAAAVFLSFTVGAQTVDEIVDKHVQALGGMDKLKGVKSIYTERSLSIQGMDIPSKSTVLVGKALRTESAIMGNAFVQVIDGTSGWMIRPASMGGSGQPEDLPAEVVKQQIGQLQPFGPLVGYKENGHKVELIGKEKVNGKDSYHLKVLTKDGQSVEEYLDASTYLVNKIKMTLNGQQGEMNLSDYKPVEGIPFANTAEMANEQAGNMVFITKKITLNAPVDEAIFKKPAK